jgi:hypothetical protein
MRILSLFICVLLLSACSTTTSPVNGKTVPERSDKSAINQIGKTDFDRMADVELAENEQSLRILMIKLYKRNPRELQKSTSDSIEKMVDWVFDGEKDHHWQFSELGNKQGTDAINLAFDADYQSDRVLAFIVGLHTMLAKAHNDKKEFYLTDSIDAQKLYNVARNIEIAAWKLGNSRDANGNLYLLSNEPDAKERNLSFERELGKMIGRTDLYAIALAEKTQRGISRVVQSLATAVFLPF